MLCYCVKIDTMARHVQVRALNKKAAKAEKVKNEKGGHMMWSEVGELGKMVRAGDKTWEDLGLDDIDIRLKWAGLFHRRKRAPGTFMMRLKARMRPARPLHAGGVLGCICCLCAVLGHAST